MDTSLTLLRPGVVTLRGEMGKALQKVVDNRLKKVDYRQMVDPYRFRSEADNKWRCEFWGKVVRSAVYAWRGTQDAELKQILAETVKDMLSTQTPDGCISSYPAEKQLGGWDIWGRKYVLLAMLAYYQEIDPDPAIPQAMVKMVHQLLSGGTVLQDRGEHYGIAASSILRGLQELWRASGDPEVKAAADKLASVGCSHLHNIFKMAQIGVAPGEIANGKAYEMTSCFQGLAAICSDDKDPEKLQILEAYYRSVRDQEIFITGCGGMKDLCGEFWFHGKSRQMRSDCGGVGETCVTVTWLAYCMDMLKLTGDLSIGDEMERSFYNALLGSLVDDGSNFIHINPTLSGGWKKPALDQMPDFPGHDCCRAQGPYGLALAPMMAVMQSPAGYAVNLYEDLTADGILEIKGNVPVSDTAEITVLKAGEYEIALRIPAEYGCRVNGKSVPAGVPCRIRKNWTAGEKITVSFDHTLRQVSCGSFTACAAGPWVLCREENGAGNAALFSKDGFVDYASAGKRFSADNTLTVWFKEL